MKRKYGAIGFFRPRFANSSIHVTVDAYKVKTGFGNFPLSFPPLPNYVRMHAAVVPPFFCMPFNSPGELKQLNKYVCLSICEFSTTANGKQDRAGDILTFFRPIATASYAHTHIESKILSVQ